MNPLLLTLVPVLISEIGQGVREYLRRKDNAQRLEHLEQRVNELERWKKT